MLKTIKNFFSQEIEEEIRVIWWDLIKQWKYRKYIRDSDKQDLFEWKKVVKCWKSYNSTKFNSYDICYRLKWESDDRLHVLS